VALLGVKKSKLGQEAGDEAIGIYTCEAAAVVTAFGVGEDQPHVELKDA
jgi:hypothetical protein